MTDGYYSSMAFIAGVAFTAGLSIVVEQHRLVGIIPLACGLIVGLMTFVSERKQ